ncbi:MAG: response regulator [Scytolyngbya sp. HA4215-MV1]|jgi:signal transduction histidine kinase|nr:response regulator [Scytolyngbya sp. HA4215-MV1]
MFKILLIEDECDLRESLLDLLEMEGFESIGAENGQIGIQRAQAENPHLIICDILMPDMDGYEVLSTLRNEPKTALIPFIFLTALGSFDNLRQGMNLGADDYLTKPFAREDLLATINTRLNKQAAIAHLQQRVETLQADNLNKDEFLNIASHELRAPMTNILVAVKMLKNLLTQERQQRYVELVQAECSREIGLINNLLELQQLKTNSRPQRLEALRLQDWLPNSIEPYQVQAKERQQSLQINVPPYLPTLLVDSVDLQRIVGELLDNACKYTAPKGKIFLEIHRSPLMENTAEVPPTTLVVSNEADIPLEAIAYLFNEFYRVPGSDCWQQGGSGLGLTLIKQLIRRMQGKIQITSEGGWAQATVQLPLQTANNGTEKRKK